MHRTRVRHLGVSSAAVLVSALVAGCGGEGSAGAEPTPSGPAPATAESTTIPPTTIPSTSIPSTSIPSTSESTTAPSTTPPASTARTETSADDHVIEGMFDVGGHELHLRCAGTGSPTVLYLHGAIWDPGPQPVSTARPIEERLSDSYQFCAYERRNVGTSDTVDAPQRPDDVLADLNGLLDAAGVEPPYVLLGASFGGLVANIYANTHPDDVVGMVLLDAMFPDELSLDDLFPVEERYETLDAEDENDTLERISHFKMISTAASFIGKEPAIPVIYLASAQEPWNEQDFGIPEYDAQIIDLLEGYVGRFSPGELVWADSPHFMEPAIPDQIAESVRTVIARAEQG
jgi:pimeloyl-ACP methyl ester carboxylesterase